MKSAICTLFEGNYHIGVAALLNSLYKSGYRGDVWAGYRGILPQWANGTTMRDGVGILDAASGLTVHFLPADTKRHFTNFKADFLIESRRRFFPDAENVFYFDPDIVLKCEWAFFEDWVRCGVALCEDVNSPMHSTHPVRIRWRNFYAPHGFSISRELDVYVNGGFVGLSEDDWEFVETWKSLIDLMELETAGLGDLGLKSRAYIFHRPDQDALNIAAMFSARPISIIGKDGMGLMPGGFLMSHALGSPKPWQKGVIRRALGGQPPTLAEKEFWKNVDGPLAVFSRSEVARRRRQVHLAAAIGRFVSRS